MYHQTHMSKYRIRLFPLFLRNPAAADPPQHPGLPLIYPIFFSAHIPVTFVDHSFQKYHGQVSVQLLVSEACQPSSDVP